MFFCSFSWSLSGAFGPISHTLFRRWNSCTTFSSEQPRDVGISLLESCVIAGPKLHIGRATPERVLGGRGGASDQVYPKSNILSLLSFLIRKVQLLSTKRPRSEAPPRVRVLIGRPLSFSLSLHLLGNAYLLVHDVRYTQMYERMAWPVCAMPLPQSQTSPDLAMYIDKTCSLCANRRFGIQKRSFALGTSRLWWCAAVQPPNYLQTQTTHSTILLLDTSWRLLEHLISAAPTLQKSREVFWPGTGLYHPPIGRGV